MRGVLAKLLLMVSLALLDGCATQPIATDTSSVLDQSQVLIGEWSQPAPDRSILLVSRDKGLLASGCAVGVYVNDTRVAALRAGEQIRLYPPSGDTIVGARFAGGICGREAKQFSVTLKPGVESKARIGYQPGGLFIEPSAF